jgi:hypothetical protein
MIDKMVFLLVATKPPLNINSKVQTDYFYFLAQYTNKNNNNIDNTICLGPKGSPR